MSFTGIVVGIFMRSFGHILSCGCLGILTTFYKEKFLMKTLLLCLLLQGQ